MRIDTGVLGDAATGRAEDADRVRFIDHEHRVMPVFDLDESREVRHIAVGTVNTFDEHERPAMLPADAPEHAVECRPVVVRKDEPPRPRVLGAQHAAVVQARIAEHDVVAVDETGDGRHVRRVTADVHNRVVRADEFRDRVFEFSMHRPFAGGDSARRDRTPPARERLLCGPRHHGIARQPEIVVAREIHDATTADDRLAPTNAVVFTEEWIGDACVGEGSDPRAQLEILAPARHVRACGRRDADVWPRARQRGVRAITGSHEEIGQRANVRLHPELRRIDPAPEVILQRDEESRRGERIEAKIAQRRLRVERRSVDNEFDTDPVDDEREKRVSRRRHVAARHLPTADDVECTVKIR